MSTPAKHTPWTIEKSGNGDGLWSVVDARGALVFFGMEEETARLFAASPTMLEALKAQEHAENKNANCPDCEGIGDWAECGRCSELFGTAIELRRAAIALATPVLEREG